MIELRLGADDLARCRFAISPMLETTGAVRALAAPSRYAHHLPWFRQVRPLPEPVVTVLATLAPPEGYTPDFLTPPPETPLTSADEELTRVAATPADLAVAEIRRCLGRRQPPAAVRELLAEPAHLAGRLAEMLSQAWHRLVAPHWQRLRDVLDGDITHRSRGVARHGLGSLLTGIHTQVRWDGSRLQVDKPVTLHRDLRGEGLLLVPSVFTWPAARVMLNPPWQPTLIYPARGVGALWEPAAPTGPALARLLGESRALLFSDLVESATTTALARRHGLAPATVSRHLTVMRDAGLVLARRHGRSVRYEHTPLGHALMRATRARRVEDAGHDH